MKNFRIQFHKYVLCTQFQIKNDNDIIFLSFQMDVAPEEEVTVDNLSWN